MSRDEDDKSTRLFDTRIIERNIRKGLTTRKDYDKHLKTLPDVSDKIAPPEAPRSSVASVSAISASEPDDDMSDDTDELDAEGAEGEGEGAEDDESDDDDTEVGTPGGVGPTSA